MSVFTYRKRVWLNPVSTGSTSYILAEVESSHGGESSIGHHMLTIADCRRVAYIHFELYSARDRRQALKKINLMIETLARFGAALKRESDLIENFKKQNT